MPLVIVPELGIYFFSFVFLLSPIVRFARPRATSQSFWAGGRLARDSLALINRLPLFIFFLQRHLIHAEFRSPNGLNMFDFRLD